MADKLKNLLLAALLALMGILLAVTFLVSVRGSSGGQRLLRPLEEAERYEGASAAHSAAQPEMLTLLAEQGVYLADDAGAYDLLLRQAEPLCQEAVGSAGTLQPLTEGEYLQLLQAPALLLQYHAPQPFYLLQAWGGSDTLREGVEVSGAALAARDQTVVLLLTDRKGARWLAETAASRTDLEALCANVTESNARLAGEDGALAGDAVLTLGVETSPVLSAVQPELARRGELSQNVQSLFGMNAYLTKVYQNTDGSLVYVESHSTISLSPAGDLTYTGAGGIDLELTAPEGPARQVELCQKVYDLLCRLWEQAGASGQLSLEELDVQGGRTVLRFGLHRSGLFAERREGHWATVTVEDGAVTGLSAALRQLEETEQAPLLPLYQAAAVLPRGRAWLRVRLLEQQDGSLRPGICRVTEE